MKPILFFIACLLAVPSFAQDNHDAPLQPPPPVNYYIGNEVILSHGFLTPDQTFANNGRYYNYSYDNNTYTGAIAATYRYHLSKLISLGIMVAYNHEDGRWTDNNAYNYLYNSGNYNPVTYGPYGGSFKRNSITIAPEITFNYCHLGHGLVNMYSVVGLGYTYRNEKLKYDGATEEFTPSEIKPVYFNMYLSPFGVRFGKALSGFFELGLGYKGVLSYGLTYRF